IASIHASRVEARKAASSKGMGASHAAHHQGSRPVAKYCNTPESAAATRRVMVSVLREPVESPRVQAEDLSARLFRQGREPLFELAHHAERSIDMRIVRRPDEVVGSEVLDHLRGYRLV